MLHRKYKQAQCKLAHKLPSAAFLLQRYAFLLKDAKILGKMFEGEGDKKGVSSLARCVGQEGYTLLYYSSFISFSVKPIIKAICSMLNPLSSILRAILFFSSALPSSIPSNQPILPMEI